MGMASPLIVWLLLVMNSIPTFPHIAGDVKWAKNLSEMILNWRMPMSGIFLMDVHFSSGNSQSREGSSNISL